MTTFFFVIGIALVGLTARLVAGAVSVPRLHLKAHLRDLEDYGFTTTLPELDRRLSERLRTGLRNRATALGLWLMRRVPSMPILAKSDLNAAGFYDISQELVHGYRAMLAVGLPGVIALLLIAGGKLSGLQLVMLLLLALGGWQMPSFIIRKRGSARIDEVDRQLPELIDLLIATIEAGMGFGAALQLIADRMQGALGDELRLTMRQQSLGMSMTEAMASMAERCQSPSVGAFVRTAGRGESLGVSIGPVLREVSADQRRRRRMAAREKMQKAPIKMIFPVMFLIFPALFIVLMYPAVYAVMKNLSGV
jgi:Flp pilus assembly protein TadB